MGKILEQGYLYQGLKPVNWCLDCGSALAEAEVEYEDKNSPAIDVAFEVHENHAEKLAHAFGLTHLREPTVEEAPVILDEFANTASAGSIIAFHRHRTNIQTGDVGVICSFGAGYSIGSVIVKKA